MPPATLRVDTLITNAYIVLEASGEGASAQQKALEAGREIDGGWIALAAGRVHSAGPSAQPAPSADRVIDAGGRLVTPGLVNTHHHMYQNLTRAFAPAINGSLFQWLTTLYPRWAALDEESTYLSTYVACAELLLGGCTTSSDHMYVHPKPNLIDAQVKATTEIGFRFMANRGSMTRSVEDGGLPPKEVVQDEDTILADSERLIEAFHDPTPGAMTRVALAPCSMFSVSESIMRTTAELAEKHDVRLHTHLAEDKDEDTYALEVYGRRPVEYFEDVGWATPRSWVAHYVYGNEEENRRLAAAGVSATQCPSSNMIICGDAADAKALRSMGMSVGIGCDGSASADSANLWMETRGALLLARHRGGPAAFSAREALNMATLGSAANLGWADEIGHLRPGACADLVMWESAPLSQTGAFTDPVEAWLRSGPARAWHSFVAGRALIESGELKLSGLEDILPRHRAAARTMQGLD
ncbi:amidohydrolase family protein [Nesterenkonia halotolerans]|uniref:Cytosine/adenosine deaminase-related metal-dependent hydrolase n=1 Tax=Nesterenkonia halotolerans TaxID=225325 RepID=A0ABR9J653_9MICC|nr:amidohydrolase family protein [Nesterenkonia halotolerans]MBE1514492.1 cytosine/adenosine deaminase-related metal-dependent hydrolase [Nesterenkonia halotolerans]